MAKKNTKDKQQKETPLMQQYNSIKAKHPDAILLFRVGDFYETFGQDAVKAAKVLGIVQTKRKNGAAAEIELAGFPHHALETYLPKLVRAGLRVAICDQLEDPKQTKTIVKRGITELVTPGVSYHDQVLDHKRNNFLAAIHLVPKDKSGGIAFLDISTGEFLVAEGANDLIDKLLQSFAPNEVLVQRAHQKYFEEHFGSDHYLYYMEDWAFTHSFGEESLLKHFQTKSLKGFGVENLFKGISAAGACLQYLKDTQHHQVEHINKISRVDQENFVWLDRFTIRNLELFHSPHPGAKTVLDVLDNTKSPMGARLLKRWLALPLKDTQVIDARLNNVQAFIEQTETRNELQNILSQLGDVERLISRVSVNRVTPRELEQLQKGLAEMPRIIALIEGIANESLNHIAKSLNVCSEIQQQIETTLVPDAPNTIGKSAVITKGIHPELDELRSLANSSKGYLEQMLERETETTGIPSLKISFNNVFGYYFEVRNTHKDKVPETWIRKQTLVNAERYITEELKDYESKILGAEEKIQALEFKLYQELIDATKVHVEPIQRNAQLLAELDCLAGFAENALLYNYCKPAVHDGLEIGIKGGRHPVIELQLDPEEAYITNDVLLTNDEQQIMMITGPNMSGKSALLRQTALITLFAQIGSFVPATKADLGVVDKVFTRVGASDNISMGESTFMVEMNETASILNNLSERSLILLDEIGRGTSTYDGISIAWAIASFIHASPHRPKTLFATHYHELNDMCKTLARIKNFNVSIKQVADKVLFVRKLVPGGSNHSFGIHVAQMAGMPKKVISKAKEILEVLESSHQTEDKREQLTQHDQASNSMQLSFFQLDDPTLVQVKEELERTDINTLTPIEALMKLNEIKKLIGSR